MLGAELFEHPSCCYCLSPPRLLASFVYGGLGLVKLMLIHRTRLVVEIKGECQFHQLVGALNLSALNLFGE